MSDERVSASTRAARTASTPTAHAIHVALIGTRESVSLVLRDMSNWSNVVMTTRMAKVKTSVASVAFKSSV